MLTHSNPGESFLFLATLTLFADYNFPELNVRIHMKEWEHLQQGVGKHCFPTTNHLLFAFSLYLCSIILRNPPIFKKLSFSLFYTHKQSTFRSTLAIPLGSLFGYLFLLA